MVLRAAEQQPRLLCFLALHFRHFRKQPFPREQPLSCHNQHRSKRGIQDAVGIFNGNNSARVAAWR
jgi:hypothetical protein